MCESQKNNFSCFISSSTLWNQFFENFVEYTFNMHISLPPLLSETLPPLSLCLLSCNLSIPICAPNVSWTCGLLQECNQITMNYTVKENQFFSGYQWKIGPQIGVELHSNLLAYSRIWSGRILHSTCVYYELVHMCSCPAISLCSSIASCALPASSSTKPWVWGKGCDVDVLLGTENSTVSIPGLQHHVGLCISHLVQQIETSLMRVKDTSICGYTGMSLGVRILLYNTVSI